MDLDDINKQMLEFNNDFNNDFNKKTTHIPTTPPALITTQNLLNNTQRDTMNSSQLFNTTYQNNYQNNINDVNFTTSAKTPITTEQIIRPTKTGNQIRDDINEKFNIINMSLPAPILQSLSYNVMSQNTRNNSTYIGNTNNKLENNLSDNNTQQYQQQQYQQPQQLQYQQPQQQQPQQQYQQPQQQYQQHQQPQQYQQQQQQRLDNNIYNTSGIAENTHSGGLPLLNVCNMYSGQIETNPNKIHNNGYNKIDEKRGDYRNNINTKIDNFIFDNPNATQYKPIIQQNNNQPYTNNSRDMRMIIQDSSKDYYRQEANSRISQYSPLSRASNIPINIANMSVNDFYSNMNSGDNTMQYSQQQQQPVLNDNKNILNSRLEQYAPLAKTIQYQTQQPQQPQQPQLQQYQNKQYNNNFNKPILWNPNDVNIKNTNMVYNELPVMSNN